MATDLVVPKLGESIAEAIISKWLKNVGEPIAVDEPVVDLETDKVSVAVPSPTAGVLTEQRFQAGATVKVGEVIGLIAPGPEVPIAKKPAAATPEVPKEPPPAAPPKTIAPAPVAAAAPIAAPVVPIEPARLPQPSHASPSVRKALREGAEPAAPPSSAAAPLRAPAAPPVPTIAGPHEEVVAMTPLRKRIAERLVEAQHTAAIL